MNYYSYMELRKKAMETRKDEDIAELAAWLQQYGSRYWNGEIYDIDNGFRLRPIYKLADAELEEYDIVGWEIE